MIGDSFIARQTDRGKEQYSSLVHFLCQEGAKNKQVTSLPAEDNHTGTG